MVLWGSRIGMQKKLILTFIFSLVFLTIAITIVRGSIFHGVYSSTSGQAQMQSATFTWFWFYCEFSVGMSSLNFYPLSRGSKSETNNRTNRIKRSL